ncbi:receptor-like serine/threonine-protein kinase At1g78530 isoform X1 [Physcomitrium patens]|uniref:Protein kinase domain-containing protein n=1 Tax=Physcomitrium patens TaxID=3218 RepID=A0A7I4DMA9_PHYPA|nr:receptor-like serine/threonine-protein kinase At1g78530 isoform X1 [Physcomitrium patens]|eukprot:XP_024373025.1 receptor-like serine/threonine-protein kinase At1g78530 isoform X1 [Physcomitrella patens]
MVLTLKHTAPRLLHLSLLLLALHYRLCEALNSEGLLLQSFKQRLTDPSGVLSNWNASDETPCNWKGVVCRNSTNAVAFIDLPYANLTGTISSQLAGLKQLKRLSLLNNQFRGKIPESFSNLTSLEVLNMRSNAISGNIPATLGSLKDLRLMDLSNNELEGPIPESFSAMIGLLYLNLSNNLLVGRVPEGALRRFNTSSFVGNTDLCGGDIQGLSSCDSSSPLAPALGPSRSASSSKSSFSAAQIVLLSVGLFLSFKFVIAVLIIVRWMRKDSNIEIDLGSGGKLVMFQGATMDLPSSKEMLRAVRLIRKKHIIGEGGYGVVYKLQVNDHPTLAIKKLKTCLESERSFENELSTLGTVKHRNLVRLRGFCSSPSVKLLIFDYLPGGNVDQLLHGEKEENVVVDWSIRYRIALGVARGLAYLHHACEPRIIHGDISSSNILLDTGYEPYLSDFGLAKLVTTTDTHVTLNVGGTFGYVAPEFAKSGRATEKVDSYSYGVILLELLSGRRAVDESLANEYANLAGWVRELHIAGKAKEIVDQNLRDTVPSVDLDLVLEVACHCVSLDPEERPHMSKVVEMLELLSVSGLSPGCASIRTSLEALERSASCKPLVSDVPGFRPVGSYFIFDT